MKHAFLFLLIAGLCLLGCSRNSVILFNLPLHQIQDLAQAQNKPFCVVLVDSTQNLSKEYFSSLSGKYGYLTNQAIYNIVNLNENNNDWYIKWLCPVSIPLTCVFSPCGQLIDIIPGATRESFLYIGSSITQKTASAFHWPNRFGMQKDKLLPLFNDILIHKDYIANGVYLAEEIDSLIYLFKYPYITYLKLAGELIIHDTVSAKITSKSLLALETPYNLETYKTEFLVAKRMVNPNFCIDNEPTIRVDESVISLGECSINKVVPIKIMVYNDGLDNLNISKIITSCSCIKHLNKIDLLTVAPKDSVALSLEFIPDITGNISRRVVICSNAIGCPFLNINISAKSVY